MLNKLFLEVVRTAVICDASYAAAIQYVLDATKLPRNLRQYYADKMLLMVVEFTTMDAILLTEEV